MKEALVRVLLIEDDLMVQELNKQFIEKVGGFKVIETASNGKEGIKKIKECQPDLIVLDIYMPHQNGVELLHQIRKEKHSVDVIVVSAANDRKTVRTMFQNGVIDYVIKPFKFERIKSALETYRNYKNLLEEGSINQQQLDKMFFKEKKQAQYSTDLPKGLTETTLKQIKDYLREQEEGQSSEDIALKVGFSRVTVRKYLEYLRKHGEADIFIHYAEIGRPIKKYFIKK